MDEMKAALEQLAGTTDPGQRLATAIQLRQQAEELERSCVHLARAAGASWATIGQMYGVSRQAVYQRFSGTA
ncbi:MAG TPA: hypothetical protein VM307_16090 [Egibacteraceae bacterium]|nr:hypothetical protein [Egibacteraceae bacterium]